MQSPVLANGQGAKAAGEKKSSFSDNKQWEQRLLEKQRSVNEIRVKSPLLGTNYQGDQLTFEWENSRSEKMFLGLMSNENKEILYKEVSGNKNVIETKEVVINVVNYAIVQQMSLSSCEYAKGVNEFEKCGLTPIASELVKSFRVKESPVQFECKVLEVKATGTEGGAGNLIICEVLVMHINDNVLNEQQQIDPHKIDLVARMGGDHYCRASITGALLYTACSLK